MANWVDDPGHPFAGIVEKLKRSNESISNLHYEIMAFFEASKYPVIPDTNSKEWQDAVSYHADFIIPKRFSVLSGEIVHQLRTCLDHIAWHFSSAQYRIEFETAIEFPVYRKEPVTKDEIGRYERKVKGITNSKVLSLIRKMQPYQRGSDAESDPLCIVHDMDRFDKHRELAIISARANVAVPLSVGIDAALAVQNYSQGKNLTVAEFALARKTIKQDATVSPQVAFAKFGKRKDQFVVPGLLQLHEAMLGRIDIFSGEV
jgi:hypothetical protein